MELDGCIDKTATAYDIAKLVFLTSISPFSYLERSCMSCGLSNKDESLAIKTTDAMSRCDKQILKYLD